MTFISPADAELPAAAARMMAIETKATHHTILHCALCIVQAVICVRVGGLWLSASSSRNFGTFRSFAPSVDGSKIQALTGEGS